MASNPINFTIILVLILGSFGQELNSKEVRFSISELVNPGVQKCDTGISPIPVIMLDSVKYKAVPVMLLVTDMSLTYSAPTGHPCRVIKAYSMKTEEKEQVDTKVFVTRANPKEINTLPVYRYTYTHKYYADDELQPLPNDLLVIQEIKQ